MLVLSVGAKSQEQLTQASVPQVSEIKPTFLQERMTKLAEKVGFMGMLIAIVLFTLLLVHSLFLTVPLLSIEKAISVIDYLLIAITIAMIGIPEGLPLAVSTALSYTISQMGQFGVMLRQLNSCENMGRVSNILANKTGTITKNEIEVNNIWVQE